VASQGVLDNSATCIQQQLENNKLSDVQLDLKIGTLREEQSFFLFLCFLVLDCTKKISWLKNAKRNLEIKKILNEITKSGMKTKL